MGTSYLTSDAGTDPRRKDKLYDRLDDLEFLTGGSSLTDTLPVAKPDNSSPASQHHPLD
jgi:hypothetical protein